MDSLAWTLFDLLVDLPGMFIRHLLSQVRKRLLTGRSVKTDAR
jgi:hypothetical protein